eukprot:TRINITY_DN7311_c0_g1_i1.p1 TRINITY_DN7311_c0_g1~~TRINITY_DN7311_c0_g1_i1.p1  ORF type:complete len:473 (+),score=115.55 TRINITY_DN7311_c0_g1_i1:53-1420(+)
MILICTLCFLEGEGREDTETTQHFCSRCGGLLRGVDEEYEFEDRITKKVLKTDPSKIKQKQVVELWELLEKTLNEHLNVLTKEFGISIGLLEVTKKLWEQWLSKEKEAQQKHREKLERERSKHNQSENGEEGNVDNDSNNNNNDENGEDNSNVNNNNNNAEMEGDNNDEGNENNNKKEKKKEQPKKLKLKYPSAFSVLCLVYLGCHKIHEPVFLSDYIKWVVNGKLTLHMTHFFNHSKRGVFNRAKLMKTLSKVMNIVNYQPPITIPPFLGVRLLNEFSLPPSLLSQLLKISKIFPMPQKYVDIELWSCATLVILVKLIYGLDGKFRNNGDYTEINTITNLPPIDKFLASNNNRNNEIETSKSQLSKYLEFCKREYFNLDDFPKVKEKILSLENYFLDLQRSSSDTTPALESSTQISWNFPLTTPQPQQAFKEYTTAKKNSAIYHHILKKFVRKF